MTWPQTSSLQRQPDWRGSGNQLWTRGFFALLSDKWRNPRLSISQSHRTAMWTVVRCPMQTEFALKVVDHKVGWHGVSKKALQFKLHTKTCVLIRPLASIQMPRPLLSFASGVEKTNFATCRISFCIELDLSWIGWSGRRQVRRGQLARPSPPASRWLLHLRKPPQARPMWLQKEPGDRRVN